MISRLAVVLMLAVSGPAEPDDKPLSVCELLSKRLQYSGKMVVVRGEVKPGGHGPYLIASADCGVALVTKGVTWPNVVNLAYPDNRSKLVEYHADFEMDWRSVEKAESEEKRQRFNPETDRIFKTFSGLFETFSDLENRVTPELPNAPKRGFGPLGLDAPAQLLIKNVRDVVVVREPRR